MDQDAREKLHATAALQCLLCGEEKAERVAKNIPKIVDALRAVVVELDNYTIALPDTDPRRRRSLDALALIYHIDTGRPL